MSVPSFTKTFHNSPYPAINITRPELSMTNKSVVITGGGAGIGLATARAFALAGAKNIIITGRTLGKLQNAKKEIERLSSSTAVHLQVVDMKDQAATNEIFASLRNTIGPLEVLVHNASYLSDIAEVVSSDVNDWWEGFEVNVKGTFVITRAFLHNSIGKGAVIINVSSAVAHFPFLPGYSSYAGSKAAAVRLLDYIAGENAGVRVVSCHPGVIDTDMGRKSAEYVKPAAYDDIQLPASFIVWLASTEADFLKGRFVWSNWDVTELKAREQEIVEKNLLTLQLAGWP
ncbi:hypothetical protein B7463_g10385, partial [Scytalidium lignicola]